LTAHLYPKESNGAGVKAGIGNEPADPSICCDLEFDGKIY
jgi:hypothetical protein